MLRVRRVRVARHRHNDAKMASFVPRDLGPIPGFGSHIEAGRRLRLLPAPLCGGDGGMHRTQLRKSAAKPDSFEVDVARASGESREVLTLRLGTEQATAELD